MFCPLPWRNSPADRAQLTLGKKWDDRLDLSWEIVHAAEQRDALGADLSDSTVQPSCDLEA